MRFRDSGKIAQIAECQVCGCRNFVKPVVAHREPCSGGVDGVRRGGEANCAVSATPLENGTGFSNSVAYNTRIALKGGDNAYGWLELVKDGKGTNWRPFYIGANPVYYATESITLKAVTKTEFDEYAFKLPAINIKQSDAIISSGKTIFNGQLVYNDLEDVVEYGILVASSTNPEYELDERDVV
ncbi:MAG: hypothetical protein IKP62_12250, partial [Salinivirgaceae bacterium]|nr:hypothetical protein [Salinivirgaceae bacterium]